MKRYILLIAITLLVSIKIAAQTRAFVQEDVVKVAGAYTDVDVYALSSTNKNTSRTYFDGLGRPILQVAIGASPLQKDIIQPMVYDNLGRQPISYLPYVGSNATGAFHSSAITEQATFYAATGDKHATDTKPYSAQVFDTSPLQRVLQTGGVGDGYQPGEHYKTMVYRTNTSGETIRRWNADGSSASSFAAGTLNVAEITDEEGSQVIVYKNNQGQAVLKKQYLNEGGITYTETYYVYSDAGQLVYVVPPKAVKTMADASNYSLAQTDVAKLIFSYVYDGKGRIIEKTVPSGGTIYLVYDPFDRLVLAQDANMRAGNKWNYIKYNRQNMPISQGIYTNGTYTSRSTMQSYVDGLSYTYYFEERNSTSGDGYYTNLAFPTSSTTPLAYSYYDDYDLDGNGTADYSYSAQSLTNEDTPATYTNGMATMLRKRTVGGGLTTWLTTVMLYNDKGQLIQTLSNSLLNATVNNTQTMVYYFSGQVEVSKSVVNDASSSTTVYRKPTYDHVNRVTKMEEKYNGASTYQTVAAYEYNELGQLVDKKLHNTTGSTYLQSVDYRYTIRGQLSSINNSTLTTDSRNDDSNDVFGMDILYEGSDSGIGSTGKFNGMITAVKWRANATSVVTDNERSFVYGYDNLMRLKSASYADRSGSGSWGNTGAYSEKDIVYDLNGNITALKRQAILSGSSVDVDDLSYTYDGNQLTNVADGSGGSYALFGFKNLTGSATAYTFDANGNMASDAKKGITLSYNELNRTDRITITAGTGKYIDYIYDADGSLVRKNVYDGSTLQKTTDYIGGFTYENGTLAYFASAEGRVRNSSGTLINEYQIKDHLGNVRVSFENNSGTALVRQETSFYPFGLTLPNSTLPSAANKKLYNGGSEWQDDFADLPDLQQTFYRNYDPALGRFVGVDPDAESAESMGTYQYANNNPVMFNDPMGDLANDGGGVGGMTMGDMGWQSYRIGSGSGNNWSDGYSEYHSNDYDSFWSKINGLQNTANGGYWSKRTGFREFSDGLQTRTGFESYYERYRDVDTYYNIQVGPNLVGAEIYKQITLSAQGIGTDQAYENLTRAGFDPFKGPRGGEIRNMVDNYGQFASWGENNPLQKGIYNLALAYATGEVGGALVKYAWNLGKAAYLANLASKGEMTVYTSVSGNVTQYVGITNNLARRAAEHLAEKGIYIRPLIDGLSKADARAVEQALIEIHGLSKNGGTLLNKINSIGSSNSIFGSAVEKGYQILKLNNYAW